MKAIGGIVACALLACAGGTAAAQSDETGERVLRSFSDCRALGDAAQRLQCFDKAAAALEAAVKAKDVSIVGQADIRKARRSLFGFALPKIDLFGGGREENEVEFAEINTTVASARQVANDRIEIRLADESGAVWQTTDPMAFPPRKGASIRIRRGTLGNYFLSIDGTRVRGMRLR